MIFNAACTFLFSVLTFYTFYRYNAQPNEFLTQLTFMHSVWQFMFLTSTIAVIYNSELVTSAVRYIFESVDGNQNSITFLFTSFHNCQGKLTHKLLHDKMNQCSDAEMSLSVWNLSFI